MAIKLNTGALMRSKTLAAAGAAIILAALLTTVAACQNTGRTLDIDDEDLTGTVNSGDIWNPTTPAKGPAPRIAIYWDGNETADRAGDTITWPAVNLGASTPVEESKTAKAVFLNPPLGFDNLQWTFETETNTKAAESADGLVKFDSSVWHTGAQGTSPSEMPLIAGLGVTQAKVTLWNCDSTGARGTVSAFFILDIVEFGTAINPTLKISWDGDGLSHNNETLEWQPSSGPLNLTAAITDPPADPKVSWTISGPTGVVVFDGYTVGSPVPPGTAVKIKPGLNFGTGTVTVTATLEGSNPPVTASFTITPGPALKIHWDLDTVNHNNETFPWGKPALSPGAVSLGVTADIDNAPAGSQVSWSLSPADVVAFDGVYTAGNSVLPGTAVTIKPGAPATSMPATTGFRVETVTVTATLVGSSPLVTESFIIDVTYIPVTSVTLSPTAILMSPAGSETVTADVQPLNATNPTVDWTSSEPTIADVDAFGDVTGLMIGDADITATATADGISSAPCEVTVN